MTIELATVIEQVRASKKTHWNLSEVIEDALWRNQAIKEAATQCKIGKPKRPGLGRRKGV